MDRRLAAEEEGHAPPPTRTALRSSGVALVALAGVVVLVLAIRGGGAALTAFDGIHLGALIAGTLGSLALALKRLGAYPTRGVPEASTAELREELRRVAAEVEKELAARAERARAAEASEDERSDLLRAVSHELRTPLNAIVGFADVLMAEIDGPLTDEQQKDLHAIRSAGRHLSGLFEDIIALTAAQTGELELALEEVALAPLVREVVGELRGQREADEVALVLGDSLTDMAALRVRVDPRRIRQVLHNLGSNALRHTERGEVRFELEERPERVVVAVHDTGDGIAPDAQARVFDPFDQAPPAHGALGRERVEVGRARPKRDGAGIGLTISRRIAELHGGGLEVESALGEGSTFRLLIPGGSATRKGGDA